jgi:hypothetical protein
MTVAENVETLLATPRGQLRNLPLQCPPARGAITAHGPAVGRRCRISRAAPEGPTEEHLVEELAGISRKSDGCSREGQALEHAQPSQAVRGSIEAQRPERFVADSPLEEGVSSEPVSEMGFLGA